MAVVVARKWTKWTAGWSSGCSLFT